jgi:hypothetical protein
MTSRDSLPVIGLIGPAQSGKDSVGAVLVEEFGYTRISFADAVRDVALAINPIVGLTFRPPAVRVERVSTLVEALGWEEAKQTPEVRHLLQRIGTEAGRNILGPDVWVEVAARKADDLCGFGQPGPPFVFTDVRFENEVSLVREFDGYVVRVQRPGFEPLDHLSDNSLDPDAVSDYTIDNSGDLDALAVEVRSMMEDLTS